MGAWSVSFYPQVVLNCERQSVVGLSLDYQLLNFVGFCFYFAFNAILFWNPLVKDEYGGKFWTCECCEAERCRFQWPRKSHHSNNVAPNLHLLGLPSLGSV